MFLSFLNSGKILSMFRKLLLKAFLPLLNSNQLLLINLESICHYKANMNKLPLLEINEILVNIILLVCLLF